MKIENFYPDSDAILVTTSEGLISVWRDVDESIHVEVIPVSTTESKTNMILGQEDEPQHKEK